MSPFDHGQSQSSWTSLGPSHKNIECPCAWYFQAGLTFIFLEQDRAHIIFISYGLTNVHTMGLQKLSCPLWKHVIHNNHFTLCCTSCHHPLFSRICDTPTHCRLTWLCQCIPSCPTGLHMKHQSTTINRISPKMDLSYSYLTNIPPVMEMDVYSPLSVVFPPLSVPTNKGCIPTPNRQMTENRLSSHT